MAIGRLEERVGFRKPNRLADGKGGWKPGNPAFYDLGERWASVKDATGHEKIAAMQMHPYQIVRVRIRRQDFTYQPGGSSSYYLVSSGIAMCYVSTGGAPVTEAPSIDLTITWAGVEYNIVSVASRSEGPGQQYYDLIGEEVV